MNTLSHTKVITLQILVEVKELFDKSQRKVEGFMKKVENKITIFVSLLEKLDELSLNPLPLSPKTIASTMSFFVKHIKMSDKNEQNDFFSFISEVQHLTISLIDSLKTIEILKKENAKLLEEIAKLNEKYDC
jgi:hypothetical protein